MDRSDAHDRLVWMLDLYTRPMIGVAVRLRIPDLLAERELTSEELAGHTGHHVGALGRMMRALAARGVFSEREDGRFGPTPMSELLCADTPGSLRTMALWRTSDSPVRVAERLAHTIETGQPTAFSVLGTGLFESLASNPEDLETFTALMASGTNPGVVGNRHALAADCGAFDGVDRLVDVAGGRGQLLVEVLRRSPSVRGVLLDRAEVVASARSFLEQFDVSNRIELTTGDFFEGIPAGADAYALSFIMHDWPDDRCLQILRNIHAVAARGSRVLIIERVLPPPGAISPSFAHDTTQDINMMVSLGGLERTEAEYGTLLEEAGFTYVRLWSTGSPIHVLEGRHS